MTGMIEKVYSEAVFQLGLEENNLDLLYSEIVQLSDILNENAELTKLLSAPTISTEDKFSVIEKIFKGKISDETYNFLSVLIQKNRMRYFSNIANALKDKYNTHNGIVEMIVTTSLPLKAELREKLIIKLENTTGKKVNLVEKVDSNILGGIILNYGNTEMNSSVKASLDTLFLQMKSIIA